MKKTLSYNHSVRITFKKQKFGWFNTDPSVRPSMVDTITADHADQMAKLAAGEVADIDLDSLSTSFWAADKAGNFLGYIKTEYPTNADVLKRLWPSLEYSVKAVVQAA